MSGNGFIEPPIIPVELPSSQNRRLSLSEDWLAVVLGLALVGVAWLIFGGALGI